MVIKNGSDEPFFITKYTGLISILGGCSNFHILPVPA